MQVQVDSHALDRSGQKSATHRPEQVDKTRPKTMILMRGLPSCGKSYTSRRLAAGFGGVVCSINEYFYSVVGDDPKQFDWSAKDAPKAHAWNLNRTRQAMRSGISPVVIDDDNRLNSRSRDYVLSAIQYGYKIDFVEPESDWWKKIRPLLEDKEANRAALKRWASKLAKLNELTQGVSRSLILRRIDQWRPDLTVAEILGLGTTRAPNGAGRDRSRSGSQPNTISRNSGNHNARNYATLGQTTGKFMVLMRGLPSCGKSHLSRRLAKQFGGSCFEFDEFFYTQIGDDPNRYDWSRELMPQARSWNTTRILDAIEENERLIIVDSDNEPGPFTRSYVQPAVDNDYKVLFFEPDSSWWMIIRSLLDDKNKNRHALHLWAKQLARMNNRTHRVSIDNFLRRIERWEEMTLEKILAPKKAGNS